MKEKVEKVLTGVKHPVINLSLVDLGIIKDFNIQKGKVKVIFAFPFPNIPIKEQIIKSVRKAVEKVGLEIEIETTIMSQEEMQKFLSLEQENWKGV